MFEKVIASIVLMMLVYLFVTITISSKYRHA